MERATYRKAPLWLMAAASLALGACDDGDDPGMDAGMEEEHDGGHMHEDDGGMDEGEITAGRLLIADHDAAEVTVVDLDDTTMTWNLTVEAPARLYGHDHSRYGYAAIGDEVQILSSGIVLESHGDHYHVSKSDPAVLDDHFHDTVATTFVVHGEDAGRYAVAFDAVTGMDSAVTMLQERTLSAGTPSFVDVPLGAEFDGTAVVAFGHLIVTHPGGDGVTLREIATPEDVESAYDTQCPEISGMAANEHGVFFGCDDGLLVLEHHTDHFDQGHLDEPAGTAEGDRITTLRSSHRTEMLAGDWGQDLVIIDPEATEPFMVLDIPDAVNVLDFAIDMAGEHLIALTDDGNLHRFELADGAAAGSPIAVLDGDDAVPPALAMGPGFAYVADPSAGHVVMIHLEDWAEEGHLEVGGEPAYLAVVTVSPDYFGGHDHDHDDDHDHDHP
ncbi:MAG TPA: hypothetical protein RMH99_21495 [Sandaracinaceae bacterium LLY-WYZ-13_1]|nr:hypothetical protein [Sandaracinaceae bacterium LLY-WYZ-13_1]